MQPSLCEREHGVSEWRGGLLSGLLRSSSRIWICLWSPGPSCLSKERLLRRTGAPGTFRAWRPWNNCCSRCSCQAHLQAGPVWGYWQVCTEGGWNEIEWSLYLGHSLSLISSPTIYLGTFPVSSKMYFQQPPAGGWSSQSHLWRRLSTENLPGTFEGRREPT